MIKEIWMPIKGYENTYEISNLSKIKRLGTVVAHGHTGHRKQPEKILKHIIQKNGYYGVGLSKNGKVSLFYVHRLIATHFIPNPDNLAYVNHIDGNKLNNALDNLEWASPSVNIKHAWKTGLRIDKPFSGNRSHFDNEAQIKEIKRLLSLGEMSGREIGDMFGVNRNIISNIKTGRCFKKIA